MNKGRALVVDDDADIRNLVRSLLERADFEVYDEANGRAALRVFHQVRPDVVLLDVAMPELDGWETLERIRDLSDVPVIMLTAKDAEADRVRGLRSGADDYVIKPFAREELIARVEGLLRRAAAREERSPVYADKMLSVDFAQRRVLLRGDEV